MSDLVTTWNERHFSPGSFLTLGGGVKDTNPGGRSFIWDDQGVLVGLIKETNLGVVRA